MANFICMDKSNLSHYLKSHKQIPIKVVIKIIEVLGCDEKTSNELVKLAGYNIDDCDVEHFNDYRIIVKKACVNGWIDSDEGDAVIMRVDTFVSKSFCMNKF
jgi:hypothetical protein